MHRRRREVRFLALGLAACLSIPASAAATPGPDREATLPVAASDGVETEVVEVPVVDSLEETTGDATPPDPLAETGEEDGGDDIHSASGATSGLAVVGVTWAAGTAPEGTAVALRTRTGEVWTEWASLEQEASTSPADEGDGAPGGDGAPLRDGTEPAFVGAVDEVQVAIRGEQGQRPQDVRLVVVDPGTDEAGASVATASWADPRASTSAALIDESAPAASPTTADTVPTAATARPTIYSRAQWGADESMMTWTPRVGRVDGAVVHHTAGSNNYTADQVPSIIRGIYAYHADARGWGDIGYNFVIDKFGRIWEGRAGGIERAIVGAHAAGVNSQTFGLSLMGNYDTATVPSVAMNAMSRLLAWKLSLHGVRPNDSAVIDGRTMPAVIGHRDVAQTACPGANLYPRLGELRSAAASVQSSPPFRSLSRDLVGSPRPELLLESGGAVSLLTSAWAWSPRASYGPGWNAGRVFSPGDWNRDGRGDLMFVDRSGVLYLYPRGADGWQPRRAIGRDWHTMNAIVSGHDWDGDAAPDILARRARDGSLWLYANDGSGGFRSPRQVGWAWQSMSSITMIGDLRNGRPALVARNSEGRLITYVGDGRGRFDRSIALGPGWGGMTALLGAGDANGDEQVDLLARDSNGRLYLYPGNGSGSLGSPRLIGTHWNTFTAMAATRTAGVVEIYPVSQDGVLHRYAYAPTSRLGNSLPTSVRSDPGADVILPGDWDGDGRDDIVVRNAAGELVLHRGTGPGAFSRAGTRIGIGWGGMTDLVGAPGFMGEGIPGILALDRSTGRIWLYPGTGAGAFAARIQLASDAGGADLVVNAGSFTGRVPDVLTREGGRLMLREGNGAGLLGAPRQIGWGWEGASAIIGTGDATADGKPDVALVRPDGTISIYPGNGWGGFSTAVPSGSAPSGAAVH